MQQQQELLKAHFEKLGGRVTLQEFDARHPLDGSSVPLANLIVEWHPERKERILLCCHYDTRPFPDEDPVNPRGVFVGANDGASGTALLMRAGPRHAEPRRAATASISCCSTARSWSMTATAIRISSAASILPASTPPARRRTSTSGACCST